MASLTGAAIPAGDGLLTSSGEFNAEEACIADLILSVDAEGFLNQSTGDCIATGYTVQYLAVLMVQHVIMIQRQLMMMVLVSMQLII